MSRQIVNETGGLALQADLCLLICSNMFPEGSKVPLEDLVMMGMGIKLFEDVPNMFEVRKRVLLLIETIRYHHGISEFHVEKDEHDKQYVTLLAGTSNLKKLVALRNQFMFERETVMENWVNTTRYEHCRGLSLVLERMREFHVSLNCPKLDVLHLKYGEDSAALPFEFFQGTKELRVLSLNVPSLPYSLNMLRNLRTLHLKVINAINMSVIGGLVKLEFLSVSTSSPADIPRAMGQLKNLRLLDLRKMKIAYISQGVFSRMLKLEELYLPLSFKRWGCKEKQKDNDLDEWESGEEDCFYGDEERVNATLNEILALPLNTLQICIPDASVLPNESTAFRTIWQFRIIGPDNLIYWPFGNGSMNLLQLTGDVCDIKGSGMCNLIWRTEHLSLTRVKNLKSLVHHLEEYHFPWLKEIVISECDEVEYIIDLKDKCIPFTLLWVLKSLHLSMLPNLKQIWRGTHIGWFQNLRQINRRFCHKLKYVFPMSMASELRNVHGIEILDCDEMEGVFQAGVDDYPYGFYSLEELYLHSLPKLVGFLVEKVYASEEVYNNSTLLLTVSEVASNSTNFEGQSNGLDVNSQPPTKSLWKNKLLLSNGNNIVRSKKVSLIKNKHVTGHMEMNCAFSSELLVKRRIEKLKKLRIAFCDALRVIFSFNGKRKHRLTGVLSSLSELELFGLRNLVHIWFQVPSETMAFLNLQLLVVVDCNNLYLFTPLVANLLVQVQKIQISRCEMMEDIVAEENKRKVDKIVFPQLKALELQHMPKLRMFYCGSHAIELPLLDILKLNQCSKMETFSRGYLRTPVLEKIQLNGSTSSTGRDLNATIKAWKANAY